jgi:hypothetical protein
MCGNFSEKRVDYCDEILDINVYGLVVGNTKI